MNNLHNCNAHDHCWHYSTGAVPRDLSTTTGLRRICCHCGMEV